MNSAVEELINNLSDPTLLTEEIQIRKELQGIKAGLEYAQRNELQVKNLDIRLAAVNNALKFYEDRDKLRDMLQA